MVRSLSDDTDCFKSFKFSAVTLKFFYFSKTYNRILKSLSTFHDEKWLSNRREKLILNVIKQRTNQFLINSSLLFLSSVMHKSCVDYNKIHKKMVSAEYKRGSFWIQIGKNMQISWIHFFVLGMCKLQQWLLNLGFRFLAKNNQS